MVYIILLISAQKIDCKYSLEPPRRDNNLLVYLFNFPNLLGVFLPFLNVEIMISNFPCLTVVLLHSVINPKVR